jgi:hypothetical protein
MALTLRRKTLMLTLDLEQNYMYFSVTVHNGLIDVMTKMHVIRSNVNINVLTST